MPAHPAPPETRIAVLIPAAGRGRRMGSSAAGKLLQPLGGEPLLVHTVRRFQEHARVEAIGVVTRPEDRAALERAFAPRERWSKLLPWIGGGPERQDSVWLGLQALAAHPPPAAAPASAPRWVLVHDGARPLCSAQLVDRVLAELARHPAVVPVLPPADTLRQAGAAGDQTLGPVLDRARVVACQTPQGFHWETLLRAHERARQEGFRGTDDAQLVERLGVPVRAVPGEPRNFKLTVAAETGLMQWALERPEWGLHQP